MQEDGHAERDAVLLARLIGVGRVRHPLAVRDIAAEGVALELFGRAAKVPKGIDPAQIAAEEPVVWVKIGAFRAKHGRALT